MFSVRNGEKREKLVIENEISGAAVFTEQNILMVFSFPEK